MLFSERTGDPLDVRIDPHEEHDQAPSSSRVSSTSRFQNTEP